MQIDCNELSKKHRSLIRVRRDSASKVNGSTCASSKHHFPTISIEPGKQIDFNELTAKQASWTRTNREPFSNLELSMAAPARQESSKTSIKQGRQNDFNEQPRSNVC
jgi:hypothetical protein